MYLWAGPTTLVGLCAAVIALATGGRAQTVGGVIEIYGGGAAWMLRRLTPLPGGALALTLGHVVLGVSREALDTTRPHERIHVRQAERWGPFFIPAYLTASAWALLRRRDLYRGNAFEREAFERTAK